MEILQPDLYLPKSAEIIDVTEENSQIKTYILSFIDKEFNDSFAPQPGQFVLLSVPHYGEAPISFSSTPDENGRFHLSVRKAGKLTSALHAMEKGDIVGLRGPYGRPFPMEQFEGKNLLFVAGGIGLAPLCPVINSSLQNGADRCVTLLYGSRTPSDIAFKADIDKWRQHENVTCLLTVDSSEEGWQGEVGLVTGLFGKCSYDPDDTLAIICGPPMMIRAVFAELERQGFSDDNIITTMERHMKCGVGICRHCHMDEKLVCKDGPVFTLSELKKLDVMELRS
ncbi:MAG: FAD/NAD(P)-binding protein [Desulfobulbaceae bacterium]|nr:FAD/NAD(P)-binding protein [Desulfobulbaceae bacterium]